MRGENIAASFRTKIQNKLDEENKRVEEELVKQQVKQAVKDELASKLLIKDQTDPIHVSVNDSMRDYEATPLLQGDYDEEIR